MAKIRWKDSGEIAGAYYFSFEEFPEGADEDYVLPLAKIADNQVFMYCDSAEEFLSWATNTNEGEFEILDYLMITPECESPEPVTELLSN
jgi:hypothetical protein